MGLIGLVRSLYGDVGFPFGTGGPLWGAGDCLGAWGRGPFVAIEELEMSLSLLSFLGVNGGVGDRRLQSSAQYSPPLALANRLTGCISKHSNMLAIHVFVLYGCLQV